MRILLLLCCCFTSLWSRGQSRVDSFRIYDEIRITIDRPEVLTRKKRILVFYALPNGNTTEQTMGKKMAPGDDWHFDIQHIAAQTKFVREKRKQEDLIVVYLENRYRSWPMWKQKHPDHAARIVGLTDSLRSLFATKDLQVHLNGHSGGGSYILGYLAGSPSIPAAITRITFLDSNYGYDSTYYPKLVNWLQQDKRNTLLVFAYNDSVALYGGKPVVSARGGTWYKSHQMLKELSAPFGIRPVRNDSLIVYESRRKQVAFFLKTNPDRSIYHTQQVEKNGFIHSLLYRTPHQNAGYRYYGERAY